MSNEPILSPLSPELFASLPLTVQLYIQALERQVAFLTEQLAVQEKKLIAQERRIQELEARLAKNSSNSGKPPGSDGLRKPAKTSSLRGQSGNKPGGQTGHVGRTREAVPNPDDIRVYSPQTCQHCCESLQDSRVLNVEKRQVFDLPEIAVYVTEHQVETKECPCCGHATKASFPDQVKAPVQYGERVQALTVYLQHQHLIPPERVSQFFEHLFNLPISPGTCINVDKRLHQQLVPFTTTLKEYLLACGVLHFDETGYRCEKKLFWVHVASSDFATFYGIHKKRGAEALTAFDILPRYTGYAMHDHWKPYFALKQAQHVLCNAHHLRELKHVYEQEKSSWATKMSELLLDANKAAEVARRQGQQQMDPRAVEALQMKYDDILIEAVRLYLDPSTDPPAHKAGIGLFKRLLRKTDLVLAFFRDLNVPFTNNQAERDLRMLKVKQKISGCHRSFQGGEIACRIRSYISTARKQGWGIWQALVEAIRGEPRLLTLSNG